MKLFEVEVKIIIEKIINIKGACEFHRLRVRRFVLKFHGGAIVLSSKKE